LVFNYGTTFTTFLTMASVVNLKSIFPLQFTIFYFISELKCQPPASKQALRILKICLSIQWKYEQVLIEFCLSSQLKIVEFSA